eukprot:gene10918-12078_t
MVTDVRCNQNQNILQLRSRKVCRSLWGPVDHDKIREDLEREEKALSKELSQKWNFDFDNERPLKGRWSWSKQRKTAIAGGPKSGPTTAATDAKRRRTGEEESSTKPMNSSNITAGTSKIVLKHVNKRKSTRQTKKLAKPNRKGSRL